MPRYTEADLRAVVPRVSSLTEVLRQFGLRPAGGNYYHLNRAFRRHAASAAV